MGYQRHFAVGVKHRNNVDESITVQTYLTREDPTGTDHDEAARLFDFLGRVVSTEDLPTSHAQQRSLPTGMVTSIGLGRYEGGLQQFHRWTDTLLNTPDAELNELFCDGIDHQHTGKRASPRPRQPAPHPEGFRPIGGSSSVGRALRSQ